MDKLVWVPVLFGGLLSAKETSVFKLYPLRGQYGHQDGGAKARKPRGKENGVIRFDGKWIG